MKCRRRKKKPNGAALPLATPISRIAVLRAKWSTALLIKSVIVLDKSPPKEYDLTPEQPVSCFAGIWRQQEEGDCYAFLTCDPNPLVKPIHPKAMPVILQPDEYDRWLSGDDAAAFQEPFPSQLMSVVE